MPQSSDHRITIRLKPDEYAILMAKAGDRHLSSFMRELALSEVIKRRASPKTKLVKDHVALAQILAMQGQNHLVSAFKQAQQDIDNGIASSDNETKLLLIECRDYLQKIHVLLMNALGVKES